MVAITVFLGFTTTLDLAAASIRRTEATRVTRAESATGPRLRGPFVVAVFPAEFLQRFGHPIELTNADAATRWQTAMMIRE